jgi:hypothetical protein
MSLISAWGTRFNFLENGALSDYFLPGHTVRAIPFLPWIEMIRIEPG